jgi:hypothetical protein
MPNLVRGKGAARNSRTTTPEVHSKSDRRHEGAEERCIATFGVAYIAFGRKFPFTRTPLRFVVSGFLTFVVSFAVFAITIATRR